MLDVFKTFAVDLNAEVDGVWRDFHGAKFLIARARNDRYNKAITERYAEHREVLEQDTAKAEEISARLMAEVIADTIILDWKNVGFKGKKLPYSRENVIKLFTAPELRDFCDALLELSQETSAYLLKQEKEQEKN